MRSRFVLVLAVCLPILSAAAWTHAQQAKPASVALTPIEDVLQAVRSDLQTSRADIVKKNATFTSAQAAAFWPLFETYQMEQNAVMDEQLKGIQQYIEHFETLDDAGALALVQGHLDRDAKMVALRQRWLGRFQAAVGPKLAARVIQIDRRISLSQQTQLCAKIPLIH